MKKLFTLALGLLMVVGLAACGNTSSADNGTKENTQAATQQVKKGGKTLVVYYSASGHTKDVAGYIAKATNGDVLELQPAQPYTDADLNYRDDNSRVMKEHNNPSLQDQVALVQDKVDNWADYDTVFIGYPIWWGNAAWPVNQFIKHNDFSGKTVIPFATSVSSGLGDSGTNLQKMAGTGNWLEGKRFSSGASESEVQSWVKSLGF